MEWNEVAQAMFYGLGSLAILWVGYSFSEVKECLRQLTASVSELNVKVAIVIERTDGHEKRISKLEDRS